MKRLNGNNIFFMIKDWNAKDIHLSYSKMSIVLDEKKEKNGKYFR